MLAGIAIGAAGTAWGQVAPVGAHHTTAGPGAGLAASVSPTGGYGAAVPLDLPSPRGGLPVPLSVVYTGTSRAGAAGAGWDVPLWYVRRSNSSWRRKPEATLDGANQAVERIYVAVGGAPQLMIPNGNVYVPYLSDTYGELRADGTVWRLRTLDNVEYTFSPARTIDDGQGMADDDLWLLTEIRDRTGTDRVVLTYETYGATPDPRELTLARIAYGFDAATSQTPLHEIVLDYTKQTAFDTTHDDDLHFTRTRRLSTISVRARNNLVPAEPPKVIRAYDLGYKADPDTGKPRLSSVDIRGEEGTTSTVLPVVRYGYGAISSPGLDDTAPRVVRYGKPVLVPRAFWPGNYQDDIATSDVTSETVVSPASALWWVKARVETTRARNLMRDFTGDGVADLLFRSGNTWVLFPARLATDGVAFTSTPTTWSGDEGPGEIHVQRTFRFTEDTARNDSGGFARKAMITTETWNQFVDWNGDGRLDVIDVDGGQDSNHWKVWLNRPSSSGALTWHGIQVDIGAPKAALAARGIQADDLGGIFPQFDVGGRLAVERTRSWPRVYSQTCTAYVCGLTCEEVYDPDCETPIERTWGTDTITEWQLADVNSDGFPDLVSAGGPVRECERDTISGDGPECSAGQDPPDRGDTVWCTREHREWIWAQEACDYTSAVYGNIAFLNRLGPFTGMGAPFSGSPVPAPGGGMGVAHWTSGFERGVRLDYTPSAADQWVDDGVSWQTAALTDPQGSGHLASQAYDSSENATTRFQTDRHLACGDGSNAATPTTARQEKGEVDLDGDGLVDLVYDNGSTGEVRFNTGAGYTAKLRIESELPFAISESSGTCGGPADNVAGLTDLDGDGKPELLRIIGGQLFMASLEPAGAENLAAAGRLVSIDNGHGAITRIRYGNAKEEYDTAHQVPFPEIVVREVVTEITDGSAPSPSSTYFAYGTAEIEYDPLGGHWIFAGYRRNVALTGNPTGPGTVSGVLTYSEAAPGAVPGATFEGHAVARRPTKQGQAEVLFYSLSRLKDVHTLGGSLFAEATTTHAVRSLSLSPGPAYSPLDCGDLDPISGTVAGFARCWAAGITYTGSTEAWEGIDGPPSLRNTLARDEVVEVDAVGRPTRLHDHGDARRTDDDVCTTVTYATPPDAGVFPSVPRSVVLTDCGWDDPQDGGKYPGTPRIISATHYAYDGLPLGQVSAGRMTSQIVDRYDETGYRDSHQVAAMTYDVTGQVATITSARARGSAATRTTTFQRDAFGATVVEASETASGVRQVLTRSLRISTWPLRGTSSTDVNGIQSHTERDGFGRPILDWVTSASGAKTTLRRYSYQDHGERSITTETFPIDTQPGTEDSATGRQRARTVLDALGRPRFTQAELGADYAGSTIVSDLVEYDALGRVAFAAQPFEWPDASFSPAALVDPVYGVSTVHDTRGRVAGTVEAYGRHDSLSATSVADRRYVTTYQYGHRDGQAVVYRKGPSENAVGSPDYKHSDRSTMTALGREIERDRYRSDGVRLDLVRQRWDRLGRIVTTSRYVDPTTGNVPVAWNSSYDSLGNRLSMTEPGMAAHHTEYDEQGNPIEAWWQEGVVRHITRSRYDGLGRLTERQLVTATSGVEQTDSTDRFHYDAHSGSARQPASDVRGRLSWTETAGVGAVYHAYDSLGRTASTSYHYVDNDLAVRQSATYTAAGRLTSLRLDTPTTTDTIGYTHDSAGRVRTVHDAAGRTYWRATAVDFDGHVAQVMLGNGVAEYFERADLGRREPLAWHAQTNSGRYSFATDARDAAGRVTKESRETPDGSEFRAYEFDPLGRLSRAGQTDGGWPGVEQYEHDALGNLTVRSSTTGTGDRVYQADSADPDRLCRYAEPGSSGPCTFTYDGMGNVIRDTSYGEWLERAIAYDAGGRIRTIKRGKYSAELLHGPAGRARTVIEGFDTRTYWHFGDLIEERLRSDGALQIERRIPGPQGIVATLRSDATRTTVVYHHGDGRAPRVFTNAAGKVVQAPTYTTFGTVTQGGASDPMTSTDDLWNGGDDIPELGVVLLGPRAYDPDLGRFLQRDPISITARASTANPYAFAFSDPVNFADPSGLTPLNIYKSVTTSGGMAAWLGAVATTLSVTLLDSSVGGGGAPAAGVGLDSVIMPMLTPDASGIIRGIRGRWTVCSGLCSAGRAIAGQRHRIIGGVRAAGGYMMAQAGAGLQLVPGAQGAGVAMMALGADQVATGMREVFTNAPHRSALNTGLALLGGQDAADAGEAITLMGFGGIPAAATRPVTAVASAVDETASGAATMDTALANGATVRHSATATAIGDDTNTLINFGRSQGAAGHDVIVHGAFDSAGEARFYVNGYFTHTQQIADAVLANPAYQGGPINLVTCYGACGPAQELSAALGGVPVTAMSVPVDLNARTGLLRGWP